MNLSVNLAGRDCAAAAVGAAEHTVARAVARMLIMVVFIVKEWVG